MKVIVMGLGAVGSAAAWRLAATGHNVTGFDTWEPPHANGSTHSESRVTRETAWEGAQYVPLARRANELWRELERESGDRLFARTGGVFLARPDAHIVSASRASADATGLPYEVLSAADVAKRWGHILPDEDMVGFVDPAAGVLFPEAIVRAEHAAARCHGATLRINEPVLTWRADGEGVAVTTARGEYLADRLIISTGAWMPAVLGPLGVRLRIERTTLHWFAEPANAPAMSMDHAPVHIVSADGEHATVVFPSVDGTIKAAGHGTGEFTTPAQIERRIRASDIAPVADTLQRFFPRNAGAWLRGATCMYTVTPHGHFILDRHPQHRQIVLGSPCNGFGFKFSAATGEALAALAVDAEPPVPVAEWSLARAVAAGQAAPLAATAG